MGFSHGFAVKEVKEFVDSLAKMGNIHDSPKFFH
jgi:hypothetical protein